MVGYYSDPRKAWARFNKTRIYGISFLYFNGQTRRHWLLDLAWREGALMNWFDYLNCYFNTREDLSLTQNPSTNGFNIGNTTSQRLLEINRTSMFRSWLQERRERCQSESCLIQALLLYTGGTLCPDPCQPQVILEETTHLISFFSFDRTNSTRAWLLDLVFLSSHEAESVQIGRAEKPSLFQFFRMD